jgi:neurotransmitter:Na+ symporter, NSS family
MFVTRKGKKVAEESMMEESGRATWSNKTAFILAAAASAVGLGNMWRFPYLAAKFGGGTFIFTYLILVFTFGVSLLLLEIALGRKTRLSAIGAFGAYGKKFTFIGLLASIVPFIITPYYCIIGGWVIKYMVAFVTTDVSSLADGGDFFTSFLYSNSESYAWMLVFMAITFLIVAMGVKKGIEKANLVMMPALIVMAVGIAIYVAVQPGAIDGILYYIVPDFSQFSADLLLNAMGQMFYSLSLAMGIMITYGSYVQKNECLTSSVSRIAGFDLAVSLIAGFMIVPAAFIVTGGAPTSAGPSLMFITLPQIFNGMGDAAMILGFVFFLLVTFAALTSAISLTETCVSIVSDGLKWSRKRSFIACVVVIVLVGCFVNAGYNGLSGFRIFGMEFLDFFDFISNSVLMPIVALLTCIFVGWIIKPKELIDEIKQSSPFRTEKAWVIIIKFFAPIFVIAILVWNIIGLLG